MLTIVANWAFAQRARAAGADEVMVAPVDPIELLLRAETLVRASKVVRVGEFRLLACLAEHIGQAVSYDDILQDAFGYFPELGGTLEQVKSCVKRVRMVYRTTELVSVARGGPIQIIQVLVGTLQQILTMEVSRIGTGGAMS